MAEGISKKARLSEDAQSTISSEGRISLSASNDVGDLILKEALPSILKLPAELGASVLLEQIPHEFSLSGDEESNRILQIFDIVKAGIISRSRSHGVYFCNGRINIPEETFVLVLNYLDKRDLIDSVSRVSYKWFKASLSPHIIRWQRIGVDSYKPPEIYQNGIGRFGVKGFCMDDSTVKTPDLLWEMLSRPQFALLKRLVVPWHVKITPGMIEKIAEMCPRLEELVGLRSSPDGNMYNDSVYNCFTPAESSLDIPSLFPRMNRLVIQIGNREDTIDLVNRMGNRLVELFIEPHYDLEDPLSDSDIKTIVEKCPHLTKFGYSDNYHRIAEDAWLDCARVTSLGIKTLVNGCPRLETLELIGTAPRQAPNEIFSYIASRARHLRFLDVTCSYDVFPDETYLSEFGVQDQAAMDLLIRNCFKERLSSEDRFYTGVGCLFKYKLQPID